MKKVNSLSREQWRDLMSYLLRVEDLASLKLIKHELIEHLKGLDSNENSTYMQQIKEIENSKESRNLDTNEKEGIAEDIYELASRTAQYLGNGVIRLFSDNKLTVTVDLQKVADLDFIDSVKLADMLFTDNLPSQVEAHYREFEIPGCKNAMIVGEILLSDGKSKLSFNKNDKIWIIDQSQDLAINNIDNGIINLNSCFKSGIASEINYRSEIHQENSMG